MPTPKHLRGRQIYHAGTAVRMQLATLRETRAQATATRRLADRIEREQ